MDCIALRINCAVSPAGGGWGWKLEEIVINYVFLKRICKIN
jgi:hypothetical protein